MMIVDRVFFMEEYKGIVTRGINNIYSVIPLEAKGKLEEAPSYSCRIKGKVLQDVEESYNPIAVGDVVLFTLHHQDEGLILKRLERTNYFSRWNAKRGANQTLVANMDLVIIVSSTDDPPFRPRFIDRAIVCAHTTPVMIVLNKCDLMLTESEHERFLHYDKLGYDTFLMSAFDEEGIIALKNRLAGKTVAFIGQSGVGKSTIVNGLLGKGTVQKIGEISNKYHRGKHTTNHAKMIDAGSMIVVDTPGMREIMIPHVDPYIIAESFPEFRKYQDKCSFTHCLHTHEPGCAVKEAVETGGILEDRYESYVRMVISIEDRPESWERERR